MGQPKSKRTAMLDPRHRAKLLKEKYRQQLAERREPESDSAEIQAVDEVEGAADWAVDTVQDRAAQVPRAREKPPIKEKSAASIPRERKANEQTAASRDPLQDTQCLKIKTSWSLLPLKKQGHWMKSSSLKHVASS